jgi:CheY-like chemotaxis protein
MPKPSILIIDDDEAIRSATTSLLKRHGFDAIAVADGKSGINATKDREFDVAIIDLFMPGMDGLETTKAIRKLKPLMRVIAVSGFMFSGNCPEMPNFQAMAAEAGSTAILYKPFPPKELLQAIQNAMRPN